MLAECGSGCSDGAEIRLYRISGERWNHHRLVLAPCNRNNRLTESIAQGATLFPVMVRNVNPELSHRLENHSERR